jgi:TetR/AcrR family transcriptional regulator
MTEEKKLATRDKILIAAESIFLEKGKNGTSMQMIAAEAGVNKAMLFYYFSNKDLLYKAVLKSKFSQMLESIASVLDSFEEPQFKLDDFIETYFRFFKENPEIPRMIIREILAREKDAKELITEIKNGAPISMPDAIVDYIETGKNEGVFRDVDAKQTLISIVGMALMYFIGKPFFEVVLELDSNKEASFLQQREKSVIDLLKYGILKRSEQDENE